MGYLTCISQVKHGSSSANKQILPFRNNLLLLGRVSDMGYLTCEFNFSGYTFLDGKEPIIKYSLNSRGKRHGSRQVDIGCSGGRSDSGGDSVGVVVMVAEVKLVTVVVLVVVMAFGVLVVVMAFGVVMEVG